MTAEQCPDCGATYRPGEPVCPECGIELLDDADVEEDATDGFAYMRREGNIKPRPLADFPQGTTRLAMFTQIGITEPDAWLEVRKDGASITVECSDGLEAVVRDGEIIGVAGPVIPIERGYSEIPA